MFGSLPAAPPVPTRKGMERELAREIFLKLLVRKDIKPEEAVIKSFELAYLFYEERGKQ